MKHIHPNNKQLFGINNTSSIMWFISWVSNEGFYTEGHKSVSIYFNMQPNLSQLYSIL